VLIRGPDVVTTLRTLKPPFDPETERELIAVAYGNVDAKVRTLARKLVDKHVENAAVIKSTLGAGFHRANDASDRLRKLHYRQRGKLATALRAQGAYVAGVAFEEDEAFARHRLPRLVKKRVFDLHEWYMTPNQVESLELTTIPDIVFDQLRHLPPFDSLVLWSSKLTLPKRFVEFAPYLKKLTIGYTGITALPDVVCACTKLEELHLHESALERLNGKLVKLTALRRLTISDPSFDALPEEVCKLPHLEELRLAHVKLATLPPAFGKLQSLRVLDLYHTRITKLPDELAQLTGLRTVKLHSAGMGPKITALLPKVRFT
jgi:hypothetical protein